MDRDTTLYDISAGYHHLFLLERESQNPPFPSYWHSWALIKWDYWRKAWVHDGMKHYHSFVGSTVSGIFTSKVKYFLPTDQVQTYFKTWHEFPGFIIYLSLSVDSWCRLGWKWCFENFTILLYFKNEDIWSIDILELEVLERKNMCLYSTVVGKEGNF